MGAIALKILGVYCLIQSLQVAQYPLLYMWQGPVRASTLLPMLTTFAALGLYLGLAVALILFAGPIARWMFRDEQTHAAATDMPVGPYLQAVAFSILGVWLLVEGIVGLVLQITYLLNNRGTFFSWLIAQPCAEAALGIFLILGGPGVARLWHKLRTAGTIHNDAG
jgi:hypothetical protein